MFATIDHSLSESPHCSMSDSSSTLVTTSGGRGAVGAGRLRSRERPSDPSMDFLSCSACSAKRMRNIFVACKLRGTL
jgi:hypothetical protein